MLPHARSGEAGWRKFSIREVFALAISVEIRRRFGVPLERLKWLQDHMLDEDADHLKVAVDLMATLGLGVWLLTDLEDTFIMDSESELQRLLSRGFLSAHKESAFVVLNVSPLVNRALACLKNPALLEASGYNDEAVLKIRSLVGTESPDKADVLHVPRNRDFELSKVTSPKGQTDTTPTVNETDTSPWLKALLVNHDCTTLTVIKKDGEVARIGQGNVRRL